MLIWSGSICLGVLCFMLYELVYKLCSELKIFREIEVVELVFVSFLKVCWGCMI